VSLRALVLGCLAALLAASPAGAAAPVVEQMVVFRDGDAVTRPVAAKEVRVRVGRRRCTAGQGTALAALVRSRVGRLGLRDYGACSARARDSAGLFVYSIKGERNRGQDGWVYKVGNRGATAGAGDPSGAFGRGRLRRGQRVTWFFCRLRDGGCQRTLALEARVEPGAVNVTVRGYDDEGRGVPVEGATVSAGSVSAVSGADGGARLVLPAGGHRLVAEKDGLVRSFGERVVVP
jgi:hypothetical protein